MTVEFTGNYVKGIFDAAVALSPGDAIPIEFSSSAQRESFRTRFYVQKRKYEKVVGTQEASAITAEKKTLNGKFYLMITKNPPISTPFIVRADGSIECITQVPSEEENPPIPIPECPLLSPDDERRKRLMELDNQTEE